MTRARKTRCRAGLLVLAGLVLTGPAAAEGSGDGAVLTQVCQVTTTYTAKSGDSFTAVSCIDARYSCNTTPGVGVCAPGKTKTGATGAAGVSAVTRACAMVALAYCRSQ